jgi:hypothetical protein
MALIVLAGCHIPVECYTVCSLGEVKKSKPEKYTNKQVMKVCFVHYVTLYWDF